MFIIILYEKRKNIMKSRNREEWYEIVKPIITSDEYLKRKQFRHHGEKTVYDHSIKVSKWSYSLAKKLHADYRSAAIAGVLHDFYTTPWQEICEKQPFFKRHGFVHARIALENARKYYPNELNKKIENAILRHMFPLNIVPPKYPTGFIITIVDKIASMDFIFCKETWKKTFGFSKRG